MALTSRANAVATRGWARAEQSPHGLPMLIAATVGIASALAAATAADWPAAMHDVRRTVAFCILAIAFQFVVVDIYGRGAVGFGGTSLLALGFAAGAGPAVAMAVVAAATRLLIKRGRLYRGVFDAGQLAVASGFAALVYHGLTSVTSNSGGRVLASFSAGVTFLVCNIGLLTLAMALDESMSPRVIWRERFRWMTLYGLAAGPLALTLVLAYERNGGFGLGTFALVPLSMMFSIRQYVAHTTASVEQLREKNAELSRLADALKRTHRDTVAALSRSIEAKDLYTGGHVERVASLSVALARRLGFDGDDLEAIEIGALLHDIGKLGMPESILNKPAPLTEAEWVVMRRHPLISETILSEVALHPFVRQIARSSHERIDGNGYPDGLHGDAIPLPARIVLVADAYDALTSTRAYRPARGTADALEEIRAHAGTQFCARVVGALEAVAHEEPALLEAFDEPSLRVA